MILILLLSLLITDIFCVRETRNFYFTETFNYRTDYRLFQLFKKRLSVFDLNPGCRPQRVSERSGGPRRLRVDFHPVYRWARAERSECGARGPEREA